MSEMIWWRVEPPDIQMTDSRARALLEGRADAKNSDEDIFIQANASTMIPPTVTKFISHNQRLSLHPPDNSKPLIYGEE